MGWRRLVVLLLLLLAAAPVVAHKTVPDPTVDVSFTRAGDRLHTELRLPISVLADANLPRTADGRLARDQLAPALDLVARGLARDLDVQQEQDPVPATGVSSSVSDDEGVVSVSIEFTIATDRRLSARLRPFRAGGAVVPTTASYTEQGATRAFTIDRNPERVVFDPSAGQVLGRFIRRAVNVLFDTADYLLFALCLIAPARRRQQLLSAFVAFLAAQLVAAGLVAAGAASLSVPTLLVVQTIAASIIAIAAIQSVMATESPWLPAVAVAFGIANGVTVGRTFAAEASFAGSHIAVSLAAWVVVTELGQLWALLLLASAAGLVRRRGLTAQLVLLAVALFAGHAALHSVADRAQQLADLGAVTFDRFLSVLTLGWAAVVLCAGIASALWHRTVGVPGPFSSVIGERP